MKFIARLTLHATMGLIFASALAVQVCGQQQQQNPPGSSDAENARREADRRRMDRELRDRQATLRIVESEAGKRPHEAPGPTLNVMQIVEDFKLLQVVSHDLVAAISGSSTLDLRLVEKSASDIRKRAERLNANLALPKSEKSKRPKLEDAVDPEQLRQSLSTLDKLIIEFAHNPVFRDVNIVDAELSAKARRELDEIIALSGWVKKNCERLNKGHQSR